MSRFDELIKTKKRLVMDGPMGTELETRGYDVNDALWSAKFLREDPGAIEQIHYDYFAAGADIVTCASYQASIPGFLKAGYSEVDAEELIALSMKLVLEARERWWNDSGRESGRPYPLAAGDIGPYGAYLADGSEYTGAYELTEQQYRDFHLRRMQILKDAGAEIFAVETMPRLDEAVSCARMLEDLDADYWISFSFRNENEISEGTDIKTVVEALKDLPHLKALGVNCTPPEIVEKIIEGYRSCTDLPICAYPNSGEIYDGITKTWHGAPDGICFSDRIQKWIDAGASLIGGCCRTRPDDIKAVASRMHKKVRVRGADR
ncbi:MAG: homocysteine S-methyltransferase [Anaerovoracaceae bacterium]|nr:homocysteine S-methyltransferase [Bacillota bacterium]MDY2671440.1 homocysteine S-methyltransferase [Anaerovoracaceae bacterium]